MRRTRVVCAALVLLADFSAACCQQPAPNEGEIKQAFLRQLMDSVPKWTGSWRM